MSPADVSHKGFAREVVMSASVAWEHELQSWLEPFLKPLRHPARAHMCPLYVAGPIGPEAFWAERFKPEIALAELQRVHARPILYCSVYVNPPCFR